MTVSCCRRALVLSIFSVWVACTSPVGLRDVNGDGQIVILCFGDSITRGTALGAYPSKLGTLLQGRATVVSDGIWGEATAAGRERLPKVLDQHRLDYVILLEGINDGCNVPAETVVENLRAMTDEVRRRGAVPLVGMLFVSPDLWAGGWVRCAEKINAGIRGLPVARIDFGAGLRGRWKELTTDGLHPNNRGCAALADEAMRVLEASRE
jgi:lysophospholipase L1-like esterase